MSEYIIKAAEWAIDYNGDPLFKNAEEIVRCRDCKDYEDTGNCYFWASYEPIPGGDEYREVLAKVTPNGYCAWAERREQ